MFGMLHPLAGAALVLGSRLLPRRIAKARMAGPIVLLVDFAPMLLGGVLLALATGRPIFAGLVVFALGAGFALADYTMRETLHEPTVFSEAVELPQVFTHPHLYLPFAGPGLVIGGAAAATLFALALLIVEPPVWPPRPAAAFVAAAAIYTIGRLLLAREPRLGRVANLLRRLRPSGEPFDDAERLGPFGMLLAHTVIARAERGPRQRKFAAVPLPPPKPSPACGGGSAGERGYAVKPSPASGGGQGGGHARPARRADVPIVIVQNESFFDARRLSPLIPREFLAGFDACCAPGDGCGTQFGRIGVPGWGANTMRAEFAVLSGIPESELGYDRFNPYYALARVPLESQVWRLRRAGYRTICLHPFDRRFFRRDLTMPALGFDEFRTRETIGGSSRPPYFPDPDLARCILQTLDAETPRTLVFAITMGNHGPWFADGPALDPAVRGALAGMEFPGRGGLLRYLDGLRRSDEMLSLLLDGLARRGGPPAALAFYGDHLPSLSTAFGHFGFAEPHSDYVVRLPGALPGAGASPQRRDIAAHELGRLVVDAVLGAEAAQSPPPPSPHPAGACQLSPESASFAQ